MGSTESEKMSFSCKVLVLISSSGTITGPRLYNIRIMNLISIFG